MPQWKEVGEIERFATVQLSLLPLLISFILIVAFPNWSKGSVKSGLQRALGGVTSFTVRTDWQDDVLLFSSVTVSVRMFCPTCIQVKFILSTASETGAPQSSKEAEKGLSTCSAVIETPPQLGLHALRFTAKS